jgi:2,4-dienoyl-CoA reductase-like NADH-dependent reductase (Old Yellow Enzyme family)
MAAACSDLLDDVNAFLAASRMSPITFGRKAMNDPHFVRDLRKGRRAWPETEARVRAFMGGQVRN